MRSHSPLVRLSHGKDRIQATRRNACSRTTPESRQQRGEMAMPRGVPYDPNVSEPVVLQLVSIETLPLGATGSRRAIVKWSDGTVGEALRWYDDEVLFSEGDLLGKTRAHLYSLHFNRDREYLQSDLG